MENHLWKHQRSMSRLLLWIGTSFQDNMTTWPRQKKKTLERAQFMQNPLNKSSDLLLLYTSNVDIVSNYSNYSKVGSNKSQLIHLIDPKNQNPSMPCLRGHRQHRFAGRRRSWIRQVQRVTNRSLLLVKLPGRFFELRRYYPKNKKSPSRKHIVCFFVLFCFSMFFSVFLFQSGCEKGGDSAWATAFNFRTACWSEGELPILVSSIQQM